MTDPRELYQQVILEHNKKPRNFGKLDPCTHHAHGLNPLCGDDIVLKAVVEDGIVKDIRFQGQGCAISKASCSLMTVQVKGRPVAEARDEFHARLLYLGHAPAIKNDLSALENLQIAAAVAGRPLDEATALAALRRIGLAGREDLPSRVLSQGQKRRVALARLLCSQARLWVLDEPFVALDVAAVDQLCNILDEHLARGGLLLFTSHQAVHLAGSGGNLRLGR